MDWKALYDLIMKFVEQCVTEGRSEAKIKRDIRSLRPRVRRLLRDHIREETGIWGKELTAIMDGIREEHAAAGPQGCSDFADKLVKAAKGAN